MTTRHDIHILSLFCACVLLLMGGAAFLMSTHWTPGALYSCLPDIEHQRPTLTVQP